MRRRRRAEFASLGQIGAGGALGSGAEAPCGLLAVFDAWVRAAGPRLARVTRPVEWDGSRLVVEVFDPVWLGHLEGMSRRILEELNRHLTPPAGQEGRRLRVREMVLRPGAPRPAGPS